MHTEWCSMSPEVVERVLARVRGDVAGRVIAVGTTAARTLEAYAAKWLNVQMAKWLNEEGKQGDGVAVPEFLETNILITPGYRWKWVQGMVTNFHLPRSTLMAIRICCNETPVSSSLLTILSTRMSRKP